MTMYEADKPFDCGHSTADGQLSFGYFEVGQGVMLSKDGVDPGVHLRLGMEGEPTRLLLLSPHNYNRILNELIVSGRRQGGEYREIVEAALRRHI